MRNSIHVCVLPLCVRGDAAFSSRYSAAKSSRDGLGIDERESLPSAKADAMRNPLLRGKILTARFDLRRYLKHGHKFVEGWMLPAAAKMITAVAAVQEAQHFTMSHPTY